MAVSSQFQVRVYGEIEGQPPYAGSTPFSKVTAYDSTAAQVTTFPSNDVQIWAVNPGQTLNGINYVYSVIIVPPTGLNTHGRKYVAQQTPATLATLTG